MNRTVVFTIAVAAILLVAILIAALVLRKSEEQEVYELSDVKKELTKFVVAGDLYGGYAFWRSPEMKKQAPRAGYEIDFRDGDGGAYAERYQKFANGEYDAIVLPIAEVILHGPNYGLPGKIVLPLAKSNGADGVLGKKSVFPDGDISRLNDSTLEGWYVEASPTEFLYDLTIQDFDLFNLKSTRAWRRPAKTSKEVLEAAIRGEGDFWGLWEPELSQALAANPNLVLIWDSSKFDGYITDVMLVSNDWLKGSKAEHLQNIISVYYRVMDTYRNNRDRFVSDLKQTEGLKTDKDVEDFLAKIDFIDLNQACTEMFGIQIYPEVPATDGIVDTVIACTSVLLKAGRIDKDPLSSPDLIINSSIVETLARRIPRGSRSKTKARNFRTWTDAQWASARELPALSTESLPFTNGMSDLNELVKESIDQFGIKLTHNYPGYRVILRGHTSRPDRPENEPKNVALSLERAQAVRQRLIAVQGINPNRLRAEGMGSSQPPQRLPGEKGRAYYNRWMRVEVVLVEDNDM